jgi:arsenate reductase
MAEAILNREGEGRFQAFGASVNPNATVHPQAITALRNFGFPTDDLQPKPWTDFIANEPADLHFVFTLCDIAAGETAPEWPGRPITAHWGIPDPAAVSGREAEIAAAFDDAFGMLQRRIELLLALPIAKLDRMALGEHVKEIGRAEGATAMARAD